MNQLLIKEMLNIAEKGLYEGNLLLAIDMCNSVLKYENNLSAKFILSMCLSRLKRYDEAIKISKELATNAKGISNLAGIYEKAGEIERAREEYERAIKLEKNSIIYCNYGLFLKNIGEIDNCFKIMNIATNEFYDADLWYTYGTIYNSLNNFEKEKECYIKSLKIKSIPQTHYNLSLCYFYLCEYKKGWEEYEWRWEAYTLFKHMKFRLGTNFWKGEDLKGKSILIWCEQGIGDLIHFYRYIKELENKGATVYMKYEDPLFGYKDSEKYDYHCSVLTIAGLLSADINRADGSSYLKSTVKEEFPKKNKKKIGLCWCGNPGHPRDKERSIKLKEFGIEDIYSLVKDYSPKYYEDGELIDWSENWQKTVIDNSSYMVDLDHTAKIIEWLDIVITVDTVVGHLAGALGKKTYLILPYNYDWRWGVKYDDKTPWYNSVKLVRQRKKGNFSDCIEYIKKEERI